MPEQSRRDLEDVVLSTTTPTGEPARGARHALDRAWEAVVRSELARVRRRHARERRSVAGRGVPGPSSSPGRGATAPGDAA